MLTKPRFAAIWHEDSWFIAQCLDPDVASQGDSREQALDNLREALRLHFSEPSSEGSESGSAHVPTLGIPVVPPDAEQVEVTA